MTMISALKSLLFIVIAIVVLIILFFIGLILLVKGLLKMPLAEYANSNLPKALVATGVVFILLPVVAFVVVSFWSITSSVGTIFSRMNYESIPDVWRNEAISEATAEDDIIKALLTSADKGNREAFCRNFTNELQGRSNFDKAVNEFFSAYPAGLSECKLKDRTKEEAFSENIGDDVRYDAVSFSCSLDGEWYFLIVRFCYRNTDEPDKVGVTEFTVMNLQAAASYYADPENYRSSMKYGYLACEIKSESETDARLIGGRPYLWTPTGTPDVTAEELSNLISQYPRLDSTVLYIKLGSPNVGIKQDDSTEYGYFYEIAPQNGEPRYVYIQTDSEMGNILWSFLCTPYEVDYDHPLFMKESK